MDSTLQAWLEKTVYDVKKHWLSSKEKFPGAMFCKECYSDSLLGHEKTPSFLVTFLECNYKQYFQLPSVFGKIPLNYWMTHVLSFFLKKNI